MIVNSLIMGVCFAAGIGLVMLFPRFRNLNWGIWIALLVGLVIDRTAGNLMREEYLIYDFRAAVEQSLAEQLGAAPTDDERAALLDSLVSVYRAQGKAEALAALQQRLDDGVPVGLAQATNASREAWFDFAAALTGALAHFDEAGASDRCVAWLRGRIEVADHENRRLVDSAAALDRLLRSHRRIERNFPQESDQKDIESLSLALAGKSGFSQEDFYLLKRLSGDLTADESRRLCHAVRLFYEELVKRDKNTVAAVTQGIFAPR